MRLLFVEDDPGIGRAVSRGLAAEGYDLVWLRTAGEAAAALRADPYTVVILDLGLPDGDGLEVARGMRARGLETPVLMLTAREALADKLDGFRAGADDYLPKPFAFEELLARLRVLARRGRALEERTLRAGLLAIDVEARRASFAGAPLELTARELGVLACLTRRAGETVSRRTLLDEVWGEDAPLTENTVDVYVGYLRRRLAGLPGAPRIETARGVGFRLEPATPP